MDEGVPEDIPAAVDTGDGRGEAILGEDTAVSGTNGGAAIGGLARLLDLHQMLHQSTAAIPLMPTDKRKEN